MAMLVNTAVASGPTAPPTLAQAIALVRQDIFDQVQNVPAGTPQRFADSDLTRALNRAVKEYSFVSPWLQQIEIITVGGMRTYPTPAGAYWVETVEYPTGQYPITLVDFYERLSPKVLAPPYPAAVLGVALSDAGVANPGPGLSAGAYRYKITYVTPGGESLPSVEVGPITVAAGHAVQLSGLPLGPLGAVAARNVYRTVANGAMGSEVLLPVTAELPGVVADNTSTVFVDSTPDVGLAGQPATPGADSTSGVPCFVMKIGDVLVPADNTGLITVQIASEHQLVASGTSIPSWHQDMIVLGATAYALLAYQTPLNDLFDYQDGEMRDRIEQTQVPGAWLKVGQMLLGRFQAKLEEIKRQSDAGRASVVRWGDKPARWDRL